MIQNFSDCLPFRIIAPHDEIALYSSNGTGMGGRLVVLETGNNGPQDGQGDFSAATPGYNYDGVTNLRTENRRKFKLAPSGTTSFNAFGIVLYGTIEHDLNGLKLLFNPHRKDELMVVTSGETNNILTDGVVTLRSTAYSGIPIPGYVAVPHNTEPGKLAIVDPSTLTATSVPYNWTHVVAKVMSSSGTAVSWGPGYAQFKLMLK